MDRHATIRGQLKIGNGLSALGIQIRLGKVGHQIVASCSRDGTFILKKIKRGVFQLVAQTKESFLGRQLIHQFSSVEIDFGENLDLGVIPLDIFSHRVEVGVAKNGDDKGATRLRITPIGSSEVLVDLKTHRPTAILFVPIQGFDLHIDAPGYQSKILRNVQIDRIHVTLQPNRQQAK